MASYQSTEDNFLTVASEQEAIAFLTENGTSAHLRVPCSRYGRTSIECAPVAWKAAQIVAQKCGESVTRADLDYAMYLVISGRDDIENLLTEYDF